MAVLRSGDVVVCEPDEDHHLVADEAADLFGGGFECEFGVVEYDPLFAAAHVQDHAEVPIISLKQRDVLQNWSSCAMSI